MEPVRVEYSGALQCLSEREVEREILSRTPRARPARPGETARVFRLSARSVGERVIGRLEIVALDGSSTLREVRGKTCGEVLEALTLVARIAIDPGQALASNASPTEPEPKHLPPSKPADTGSNDRKRAQARPDRETAQSRSARSGGSGVREPSPRSRFRLGIGAQAVVSTLISPSVAEGFGIFADLAGEPPRWLGFRAGLRLATGGETETAAGTARFTLIAARLGACLPRIELSDSWTVCPIAGVEAGSLNGRGSDTQGGRSANRPWLAAGLGLRLEWLIGTSVFIELDFEASAPVVRDRFVFDEPPTTVHEPPAVGVNAGIGLGYRLP